MLTTKAPPNGSSKVTPSRIGRRRVHSCGFMENVCILPSIPSLWLMDLRLYSRFGKECSQVRLNSSRFSRGY